MGKEPMTMLCKPADRSSKGTSLVEVMIAMAIMAFVLLAFLSIMSSASKVSAVSKENAIAVSIVQTSMEDLNSQSFGAFWTNNFVTTGSFAAIYSDPLIVAQLGNINALLPRVQGTGAPLTAAEWSTWYGIVNLFKTHGVSLPRSNRLSYESINLYMLPTSDIYTGGGFNTSLTATNHNYVEYMVEVDYTDSTGKTSWESITTRRSQ